LLKGQLRNYTLSNFKMADSSLIVRYVGASVASAPQFGSSAVSVLYMGNGPIITGPEVHCDSLVLQDFSVLNTGGMTMDTNITVNRSLTLGSMIYTEPSDDRRYVLSFNSPDNPKFNNDTLEIDGSFRRNYLKIGESIILNNFHTYGYFYDSTSRDGVTSLTLRVKPHQFPQPPLIDGDTKVRRNFNLEAKDRNEHNKSVNMRFGYAWRWSPTDPYIDETNDLYIPDLKLQYFFGNDWVNIDSSQVPEIDTINGWGYSYAENVTPNHDFAIGLSFINRIMISVKVILEGAYRNGTMATDLRAKNLIPKTPDDIYPYNLDFDRINYRVSSIPDSVVDWIVLEFRKLPSVSINKYRTAFLKSDGSIVDTANRPVYLSRSSLDSGDYYIAVRHRNHLSIMTEYPLHLFAKRDPLTLDFTKPDADPVLTGLKNYLKPIHKDSNNVMLWGMIAGDVNGDGRITKEDADIMKSDYLSLFDVLTNNSNHTADPYKYSPYDISLSGKINTRDWNFVWNNRNKQSNVP